MEVSVTSKGLMRILENLDARSDEGIFLGYASTKKAYRCYNLRLHKIVESADVKVDDLKTKKIKHQETILNNEVQPFTISSKCKDVKVDGLKTKKIKHQETILDNEDEDDEELVATQAAEEEENKEEKEDIQEDDMDTSEDVEDIREEEIREVSSRRDTKTRSRITQKNHPKGLIIGNKRTRV